jgi:hypothetical protein
MSEDRCLECNDIVKYTMPYCKCGKAVLGMGLITTKKVSE